MTIKSPVSIFLGKRFLKKPVILPGIVLQDCDAEIGASQGCGVGTGLLQGSDVDAGTAIGVGGVLFGTADEMTLFRW